MAKDLVDIDKECIIVTKDRGSSSAEIMVYYLYCGGHDSYYDEEDDRWYFNRDYGDERFSILRFKYRQMAEHRKDFDASIVHAVHDPEEEEKKEDDEGNRNKEDYDRFKSRYYLITQKNQADGTVDFNVKHFEFNITCESGENPEPDNCKMKKEQKLSLDSRDFDLGNKEMTDFKFCEKLN